MVVLLHRIVFGVRRQHDIVEAWQPSIGHVEPSVVIFDAASAALAFHLVIAGDHRNHVHPGGDKLFFDRRSRAVSHSHHRHHRAHANRDADERQHRAQRIALQRLHRQPDGLANVHHAISATGTGSCSSSSLARRANVLGPSATMRPSRKLMMRVPYSAI